MKGGTMKRLLCVLTLLVALGSAPAFGQGCAMCWTSANASSQRGKIALNRGITLMLVPTLGLLAGFVGLTVVYNRKDDDEDRGN
jgi:hypothetical protein